MTDAFLTYTCMLRVTNKTYVAAPITETRDLPQFSVCACSPLDARNLIEKIIELGRSFNGYAGSWSGMMTDGKGGAWSIDDRAPTTTEQHASGAM